MNFFLMFNFAFGSAKLLPVKAKKISSEFFIKKYYIRIMHGFHTQNTFKKSNWKFRIVIDIFHPLGDNRPQGDFKSDL